MWLGTLRHCSRYGVSTPLDSLATVPEYNCMINNILSVFITILSAHAVGGEGTVLLTDRDSEVLEIAASNIARNEIDRNASTTRLAWDDDVTAERILEEYSSRNSRNKKGFDVIIGSDCLYSGMTAVRQLFSTVAHMLYDDSEDYFEEIVQQHDVEDDDGCDDIDSLPTSLNGGGWKYLQQHTVNLDIRADADVPLNSSAPTPALHTPVPVPVPTLVPVPVPNPTPVRSVFVLGYERRLGGAEVDMSAMFSYAAELGLDWCIAEDSVIDIFGNETSERTLFWEQCVLLFTRHEKLLNKFPLTSIQSS